MLLGLLYRYRPLPSFKRTTPDTFLEDGAAFGQPLGMDLSEILFTGFFPRIHDRNLDASVWLDGYLRTYVERDVRQIANIGDLDALNRYIRLSGDPEGVLVYGGMENYKRANHHVRAWWACS